ncbi:hypothetical protein HMN09_00999300 [Mycena chlorophos]|uniref:Uncharacterized protein n=1 Tax=Mycena chlorophos TaxID=658473 RepID=A0A8H6SJC4_MYCCL|nr:hypothetical protein HMN09_00999300 [Mycena chlorophos]
MDSAEDSSSFPLQTLEIAPQTPLFHILVVGPRGVAYFDILFGITALYSFDARFDKLHRDLTRGWTLDDPHVRRNSPLLVSALRQLASVPDSKAAEGHKAAWSSFLDRYQLLIGLFVGGGVSVAMGGMVAALVLALWVAQIAVRWRQHLPETTRSVLSYIIHTILILDLIFHNASTARPLHPLAESDIQRALDDYRASEASAQVDSEVRLFVDDMCESVKRIYRGVRKAQIGQFVRELVRKWSIGEDGER